MPWPSSIGVPWSISTSAIRSTVPFSIGPADVIDALMARRCASSDAT
jgi:hypothetical protein